MKKSVEGRWSKRLGEIRKGIKVAESGTGRKEGRKGRLPELFGLGSRAVTRFVARLEPDGSEVDANAGRISSRLYPTRAPYMYVYTRASVRVRVRFAYFVVQPHTTIRPGSIPPDQQLTTRTTTTTTTTIPLVSTAPSRTGQTRFYRRMRQYSPSEMG